jgi:uncharacterized membrane protein YoaK (UPF0700 family)
LLALALTGGPRWAWLPNFLLWTALVVGATIGALAYERFNLAAVWFAATAALLMCLIIAIAAWRARH